MTVHFDEIQLGDLALMHVRALELRSSPQSIVHYESPGREDHLLYYHISGLRLYRQGEQEMMTVRPGDILLLPKGSSYISTVISQDVAYGCMAGFLLMDEQGNYLDIAGRQPICLYRDEDFRLLPYFQKMAKHFKRSNTLLSPKAILSELIDEIIHSRQQLGADNWLSYAIAYMGRHLDAPLTLTLLAEKCHMSERTFSRKFKAAMNETPIAYHRRLRIQKAQEFLASGAYTLETTAEALGFTDAAHLSRCFFQETGMHAGALRKQNILP